MLAFTPDQWLILLLAFVLGLILGMALLASPKWKRRYREEVTRREEVEAENAQLRRDAARDRIPLRHAAARAGAPAGRPNRTRPGRSSPCSAAPPAPPRAGRSARGRARR